MTLWHAFFVIIMIAGAASILGLICDFLGFHFRHRRIARLRRWPTSQHASYFRDYK
jgi:hypothetical protein